MENLKKKRMKMMDIYAIIRKDNQFVKKIPVSLLSVSVSLKTV